MANNIFFSTSNFGYKDLKSILSKCMEFNIDNIELGSGLEVSYNDLDILQKYVNSGMRFLIHNYFPPPRRDFVLNLASNDNLILKRSIRLCKKAIDLCKVLKAPFYSVHAGFAFHARPQDLSGPQTSLPRFPKEIAYKIFLQSTKELVDYAKRRGVMLAIENNVVAKFNVVRGKNLLLLLAEPGEFLRFHSDVGSSNLFFLIDLGHLKVTSNSLGFSLSEFLDETMPKTIAFHLNDNNSRIDQHLPFNEKAWFKGLIKKSTNKFFIIESRNFNLSAVKNIYKALNKIFNEIN